MLQLLRYAMYGAVVTVALVVASSTAMAQKAPPAKAASNAKPTIIMVHGAFADGSSWDKVVPLLQAKGYNVVAVHQPMLSADDDVAAVKRAIEAAPGKVILVGHSYGGYVITEAGANDKVAGLVYVAAFAPDANESITSIGKSLPQPEWQKTMIVDSGGFATLPVESVMKNFAQDLPAAEQRVIAVKQGPIPVKAFDATVTNPAWKGRPVWYIRSAQDRMIDPKGQAMMAQRMKAKTTNLEASHVAMLSKPKQVAAVILQAAEQAPDEASRQSAQLGERVDDQRPRSTPADNNAR